MEQGLSTNDDYAYLAEHLKYKKVEAGHYVVKQGDQGTQCFFLIQGRAEVLMNGEDPYYLDRKTMYNEQSVIKARS